MPSVFVQSVTAQPGHAEAITTLYASHVARMKAGGGFRGGHILRELPPERQPALAGAHAGETREVDPSPTLRFVSVEIWDDPADRARDRATPEFREWYAEFKQHLMPEHSVGWFEDITPH